MVNLLSLLGFHTSQVRLLRANGFKQIMQKYKVKGYDHFRHRLNSCWFDVVIIVAVGTDGGNIRANISPMKKDRELGMFCSLEKATG